MATPHQTEHCIADLEMVVASFEERFRLCLESVPATDDSPEEQARWDTSYLLLRCVLAEHLQPMLDAWRAGQSFSRKSELMRGVEGA